MTDVEGVGMCRKKFDVLVRIWDPICNLLGDKEQPATTKPLSEADADELVTYLSDAVDPDYRGQGGALLSVRKERHGRRRRAHVPQRD